HYLRSGNRLKGIQYGLEAAREHASELAPLEAIQTYEEVLVLAGREDADLARRGNREMAALAFPVGECRAGMPRLGAVPGPQAVLGDGRWETSAYLEAARAHARLGRFDDAAGLLESAGVLSRRQQGSIAEASVLLARAELSLLRGNLVESLRDLTLLL